MSREILAYQLNSIHNLYYYCSLMAAMRDAIEQDSFISFRKEFYARRENQSEQE